MQLDIEKLENRYMKTRRIFALLPHETEEGKLVWLEWLWRVRDNSYGIMTTHYYLEKPEKDLF